MTGCDTLQAFVRALAAQRNRPALLAFHKPTIETWSFAELVDAATRLASGLLEAGLRDGEPVAIYSPNRVEWIIACLALLDAGALPVPIDSQMASDDLAHVLEDSGARRLITIRPLADRLTTLGLHRDRSIIVLDADKDDPRSWQQFRQEPARTGPSVKPENPALMFYTSGVSGRPKGVPLSHRNLMSNLQGLLTAQVYRPDERLLLPLPLHHVYPFMIGLLAPFALGLPVILPHSLTGPQILRALREGRVTAIVGVTRLYSALYAAIEQQVRQKGRGLSAAFHGMLMLSALLIRYGNIRLGLRLFAPLRAQVAPELRSLVYGGAGLPPDLAWRLAGLGWQIAGGFGLTETSPILTLIAPGSRHIDTAGTPLPGVHIRIADPDPASGQGEIQARGPNVFAGYLHLPHKTVEAFTQDGWFRTGDVGFIDKNGCVRLVGRASSRITLPGGEKIWPERVEDVLDGAPSIRETGVLAYEGRLVGVIVPRAAAIQAGERDAVTRLIRAEIEARLGLLPSYCRLTDFTLSLDPLPRTRLGKIQRHKLDDLFAAGKQRQDKALVESRPIPIELMAPEDRQLLEDPVVLRMWNWLAGRFPALRLTPDTALSLELGLDSLEWMSMTLELRDQVSVDLPEEALQRIGTVRDLLREASEAEEATSAAIDPTVQLAQPEELLDPRQRRWIAERGWFLRRLGAVLFGLDRLLMRSLFDFEILGAERIPAQGACVLTPNHASLLDPPALIAALPAGFVNRTYWGGWTGIMFRDPVMRLVSRATRVFPVDQSSRPLTNLGLGATVLARGHNLVWFPEGSRSPDGTLRPFQPGIGLILAAHPVPVVPVRIEGSFEALPPGAWWPRRRRITIIFGRALNPTALVGQSEGAERYREIAAALHDHIAGLGVHPE
ncbi:MAG: AMP-binding protein [Nitrospira sp.]|nr:AMP-binding protein [Nitrospira sp.]